MCVCVCVFVFTRDVEVYVGVHVCRSMYECICSFIIHTQCLIILVVSSSFYKNEV